MSQPETPDPAPEEPQPPSPELLDRAREILSHVEMIGVRASTIHAELAEGVPAGATATMVMFDVDLAFAAEDGVFGNRFDYRFEVLAEPGDDERGEFLARIQFSLLVDYRVDEGYIPPADAADHVASTTGYFAAYPYARELLQSLTARLHIDPVVLGLLNRGTLRPGSISVVSSTGEGHRGPDAGEDGPPRATTSTSNAEP